MNTAQKIQVSIVTDLGLLWHVNSIRLSSGIDNVSSASYRQASFTGQIQNISPAVSVYGRGSGFDHYLLMNPMSLSTSLSLSLIHSYTHSLTDSEMSAFFSFQWKNTVWLGMCTIVLMSLVMCEAPVKYFSLGYIHPQLEADLNVIIC